jgi:hypothetical protein
MVINLNSEQLSYLKKINKLICKNMITNNHLKNKAIDYCLDIIKREDVKNELKQLFKPVIQLILQEIYPYIYLSVLFLLISFFLILGIFILLLRNNYISQVLETTSSSN